MNSRHPGDIFRAQRAAHSQCHDMKQCEYEVHSGSMLQAHIRVWDRWQDVRFPPFHHLQVSSVALKVKLCIVCARRVTCWLLWYPTLLSITDTNAVTWHANRFCSQTCPRSPIRTSIAPLTFCCSLRRRKVEYKRGVRTEEDERCGGASP